MPRDRGAEAFDNGIGFRRHAGGHVTLVGEVESRLDQRLCVQQIGAPSLIERPQRAFGLR